MNISSYLFVPQKVYPFLKKSFKIQKVQLSCCHYMSYSLSFCDPRIYSFYKKNKSQIKNIWMYFRFQAIFYNIHNMHHLSTSSFISLLTHMKNSAFIQTYLWVYPVSSFFFPKWRRKRKDEFIIVKWRKTDTGLKEQQRVSSPKRWQWDWDDNEDLKRREKNGLNEC